MIKNYFKIAWRNLQRNRIYSVINITGLAIGLASTILIALWIRDEISYDRFHVNRAQLFRVMANTHWGDVATLSTVPAPLSEALKNDIPEVQYAAALTDRTSLITVGSTSFKESGLYASSDLLRMFSFPLVKGNANTVLLSPQNIVISERLARKYFGAADPVGKTLKLDNKDVYQVSGVLKDVPSASTLRFDWLIPFEVYEKKNEWLKKWGSFSVSVYVMLRPNTSLAGIDAKLKHFLRTKNGADNKDELFLQPLSDIYLHSDFKAGQQDGGRIEYVRLFSAIAFFILLIACINFMNLSTARSAERAREVGVRKVIGAERKMIIVQFMGEAALLTLFSVILSLLAAWLMMPYFNQLTGKELHLDLTDPLFLAFILLIAFVTVFLSGSYPALYLSSFRPIAVLKSAVVKSNGGAFLRKGLVVFQFTLAVTLIIGTMIIYKQISYIKTKNLGIDKGNLLVVSAESDIYSHLEAFQQEVSGLASVKSVTASNDSPIDIQGSSGDLNWPGKQPGGKLGNISATWVGYNYLRTIGVPLLKGRDFEKGRPDSNSYVINETAARLMGFKDPLGQTVSFWNGNGQIIGVAKDFHIRSLHEPITPLILVLQPGNVSVILIKTQSGKTQQAIKDIQKIYSKYDKAFPFEYHFMDKIYEQRYRSEMMIGELGYIFAMLTIFISCLGLFGLAAFTAEQRTKEIGIRKVLGATVGSITALLSKDFLKLVLVSILIAIPLTLYSTNVWLQNFAYHTELHWWIFALGGVSAILIALVTVSFQAIKAALMDPVKSLRTE